MAMEILKSFGTLQSELEQAKSSLRGVDENIKRLIGRDPSTMLRPIAGNKRNLQQHANNEENRSRNNINNNQRLSNHAYVTNDDEHHHQQQQSPPSKRRHTSVFKRLSDKLTFNYEDEEQLHQHNNKLMISKVIVTPKEVPSRQEALAAQNNDEKFKARNRRMFGALLGTLQKFQQEETKLKSKEEKRAQVEKRIEEHEIRERAEIKKERQELFLNRKRKQAEIKMIELKMLRMKEYSTWEERQRPRQHFIRTKAKPQIYYLPRKLNDMNKEALETSKKDIEKMIDKRRQEIYNELQHIEERTKKNFERKPHHKDNNNIEDGEEKEVDGRTTAETKEMEVDEKSNNNSKELQQQHDRLDDVEVQIKVENVEKKSANGEKQENGNDDDEKDGKVIYQDNIDQVEVKGTKIHEPNEMSLGCIENVQEVTNSDNNELADQDDEKKKVNMGEEKGQQV